MNAATMEKRLSTWDNNDRQVRFFVKVNKKNLGQNSRYKYVFIYFSKYRFEDQLYT
jgi:hypothetical protein